MTQEYRLLLATFKYSKIMIMRIDRWSKIPRVGCQAVPRYNIAKQAKEVDVDNELSALNTIFPEYYYWVTVVLMFLMAAVY